MLFLILNLNSWSTGKMMNENQKAGINKVELIFRKVPVFINKTDKVLFEIKFDVNTRQKDLQNIVLHFTDESNLSCVSGYSCMTMIDGQTIGIVYEG